MKKQTPKLTKHQAEAADRLRQLLRQLRAARVAVLHRQKDAPQQIQEAAEIACDYWADGYAALTHDGEIDARQPMENIINDLAHLAEEEAALPAKKQTHRRKLAAVEQRARRKARALLAGEYLPAAPIPQVV